MAQRRGALLVLGGGAALELLGEALDVGDEAAELGLGALATGRIRLLDRGSRPFDRRIPVDLRPVRRRHRLREQVRMRLAQMAPQGVDQQRVRALAGRAERPQARGRGGDDPLAVHHRRTGAGSPSGPGTPSGGAASWGSGAT